MTLSTLLRAFKDQNGELHLTSEETLYLISHVTDMERMIVNELEKTVNGLQNLEQDRAEYAKRKGLADD